MPRLAHHVFFTLLDRTPDNQQTLVNACRKYLTDHPGMVDFAAGTREPDYQRPVNQDYDVVLQTVFESREAHDTYQSAQRHLQFIEENKATWAEVRVFDSNLVD